MAELLQTPLHAWHCAQGARLVDFAGFHMPVQYKSIVEEHQAVRQGVGLFDISHMGRLTFSGPDALRFLQTLFTNDVESMKPGQARYGLLCNEAGGILDDVLIYRLEPHFWLMVVNASNRTKIVAWIYRHLPGHDVRFDDRTFDWCMIALQGPASLAATQLIDPECGQLKYYYAKIGHPNPDDPEPQIVSRTGYTGEIGFEIIAANRWAEVMVGFLCNPTTTARLGTPVVPCGLGARDTLRLEAAMPLYGHELSESIDPFQAGLDSSVKLDKGPFIGREALVQRQADASLPVRVGLEMAGKRPAREGCTVVQNGQPIGTVTSGSFGPTVQKAIAMAYVARTAAAPGTRLDVDIR
ncbi:MAG TPA: glycine cleavage system aminomethyltransferase GcvT, partial [Gemmatales bacterium]|nr:glycine cleavage system aminomethyltransferase GcvT [Gemmatales bacterium]